MNEERHMLLSNQMLVMMNPHNRRQDQRKSTLTQIFHVTFDQEYVVQLMQLVITLIAPWIPIGMTVLQYILPRLAILKFQGYDTR